MHGFLFSCLVDFVIYDRVVTLGTLPPLDYVDMSFIGLFSIRIGYLAQISCGGAVCRLEVSVF